MRGIIGQGSVGEAILGTFGIVSAISKKVNKTKEDFI
jgi:hypothetical protein